MIIDLKGKSALVCGATQGIGNAAARLLAAAGATITLVARNEVSLKKEVETLDAAEGQKHGFLVADFANPAALETALKNYVSIHPETHILVNNTGGPAGGPITDAHADQFEAAFKQHLICNHLLAQALLPGMKKAKYGRIVNVISTSVKQPLKGLGVSNTIRAAVANWSKTLAGEVAPFGITVNNVLPGATGTTRLTSLIEAKAHKTGQGIQEIENEMVKEIPMGRFADPEEIAAAILFLASPLAGYITGINVPVDGGRTSCL